MTEIAPGPPFELWGDYRGRTTYKSMHGAGISLERRATDSEGTNYWLEAVFYLMPGPADFSIEAQLYRALDFIRCTQPREKCES